MKKSFVLMLIAVILIFCGCGNSNTNDSVVSRDAAVLSEDQYSIITYEIPVEDDYWWLLCTTEDRIYYTSGVQEQMDDASRQIKVFSYNLETLKVESVELPYGEGWHLYAMTPAIDGGFWMLFTPITGSSTFSYTPNPAYLVKTDSAYNELLTIDLSEYSNELVEIFGVTYPKNSQFASEMAEEEYPVNDSQKTYFDSPEMICDTQGRVYITALYENVIVFDNEGAFLTQFDTFDPEYSQGVSFAQMKDGSIAVARYDGEFDSKLSIIDNDSLTIQNSFNIGFASHAYEQRITPVKSLLQDYDLFSCGYYGLYGVSIDEHDESILVPLFYYDDNEMPEDGTGQIWVQSNGESLVFDHAVYSDDNIKHFILYVINF